MVKRLTGPPSCLIVLYSTFLRSSLPKKRKSPCRFPLHGGTRLTLKLPNCARLPLLPLPSPSCPTNLGLQQYGLATSLLPTRARAAGPSSDMCFPEPAFLSVSQLVSQSACLSVSPQCWPCCSQRPLVGGCVGLGCNVWVWGVLCRV